MMGKQLVDRAKHVVRSGLVVLCTAALVTTAVPTISYAETSAELQERVDAARVELNNLFMSVEQANEELDVAQSDLEAIEQNITDLEGSIVETEGQLATSRANLSAFMASDYRAGQTSVLSFVLNASSFEEFVNGVYYMNRISERRSQAIEEVVELKDQLDSERAELVESRAEQQAKVSELADKSQSAQAAADEMQAYVDGLDAEVQAKIQEEQEAAAREAAERAAEYQRQQEEAQAAAAAAAAEAERQNQTTADNQSNNSSSNNSNNGSGNNSNSGSSSNTSSGGLTSAQRSTIVAAARSCIGTPYVLGARNPGVAIDCSGLTSWAYMQAGLSIPRTSATQRNASTIKPLSQCQPGDIIFWYGHVAIYSGNGMIVHANYGGVEEVPVYGSYLGGGNPFA